jgi:hypothetical protein
MTIYLFTFQTIHVFGELLNGALGGARSLFVLF